MSKKYPLPDNLAINIPTRVLQLKRVTNTYKMFLGVVYTFSKIQSKKGDRSGCFASAETIGTLISLNSRDVKKLRKQAETSFHVVSFGRNKGKIFFLSPTLLHGDEIEDLSQFGMPNNCFLNAETGIPEQRLNNVIDLYRSLSIRRVG